MGLTSCRWVTIARTLARRRRECPIGIMPVAVSLSNAPPTATPSSVMGHVSTYPRRHVIVVKHAGERQTFSVHEVAHNHVEWVGGQGHYNLGYAAAIRLMAEKVVGRA